MNMRHYFWEDKDCGGDFGDGGRVLSVQRRPGGIEIREECDKYFSVLLTVTELEEFICKLREIAAEPVQNEPAVDDGSTS